MKIPIPMPPVEGLLLMVLGGTAAAAPPEPIPDAVIAGISQRLEAVPATRGLRIAEATRVEGAGVQGIKVIVSFRFLDPRGQEGEARGKIILPAKLAQDPAIKAPLMYWAGYETPDVQALGNLSLGRVVASPLGTPLNPLSRSANLDVALLHAARALPFVDDERVLILGGSAGGYMTLMLAAETFPLAGAWSSTPPVNFGYSGEYWLANNDLLSNSRDGQGKPTVPVLAGVCSAFAQQILTYYPPDREDAVWFEHSPLAHLAAITCPVTAVFSTGDVLVPINQVDASLVQPFDPAAFPQGFKVSPDQLMRSPNGRKTLLPALPKGCWTLSRVDLPAEAILQPDARPDSPTPVVPAPFDPTKQWNIVVVDEGPMRPFGGHFLRRFGLNTFPLLSAMLEQRIAPAQLTPGKLRLLMDRCAGREWMSKSLRHLDSPAMERLDVLRGLITYVSCGDEHAGILLRLYQQLPAEQQALGPLPADATPEQLAAHLRRLTKSNT